MKNMNDKSNGRSFEMNMFSRRMSAGLTVVGALFVALATLSFVTGCEDNIVAFDEAPPAPQGVFTIRGDDSVFVFWLLVEADDFDHYNVYSALDSSNGTIFTLIGTSIDESFIDTDVVNGTRYFYAITAVDRAGNESLESAEFGGATPRFQGQVTLQTNDIDPGGSGFNFASGLIVAFDSPAADIWIDRDGTGVLYVNADSTLNPNLGDIQDMGFTDNFDEIGRAPLIGWSALGFSELIEGHTYVIRTQDTSFAKIRIIISGVSFVRFDYAYQSGTAISGGGGEPELVAPDGDGIPRDENSDAFAYDRTNGAQRTDHSTRPKQARVSAVQ